MFLSIVLSNVKRMREWKKTGPASQMLETGSSVSEVCSSAEICCFSRWPLLMWEDAALCQNPISSNKVVLGPFFSQKPDRGHHIEMRIVVSPGWCWSRVAHQKSHPRTQFAHPPPLNEESSIKIQLLDQHHCLHSSEPLITSSPGTTGGPQVRISFSKLGSCDHLHNHSRLCFSVGKCLTGTAVG